MCVCGRGASARFAILYFFFHMHNSKLIINDGRPHLPGIWRSLAPIERYSNYENALKKAEKERKEINYGNYLACLPKQTCNALSAASLSGLWFDLFKFFLLVFLLLFFFLFFFVLFLLCSRVPGRTLGHYNSACPPATWQITIYFH